MLKHFAKALICCATLNPSILYAGVYQYPTQGYRKACADGSTSHIAIYPGAGYMYLADSGSYEFAYPLFATSWSPVLGGSSLCWSRGMSQSSQNQLIKSWINYCVNQEKSYCVYE
jgi:hypothetical protein